MLGDQPSLEFVVLLEPAPALAQPLSAVAADQLGVGLSFSVQDLLGLPQPPAAIAADAQLDRQLIAACISEALVLGRVDLSGLVEDLARDLLVAACRVMGRVGGDLGALDRDDPKLDQTSASAQRQNLSEQAADRGLVMRPEARDRCVIRRLVGRDHAEGDVLAAVALDRARRADSDRVGVDQQRRHHPDPAPRDRARQRDKPRRTQPDPVRR